MGKKVILVLLLIGFFAGGIYLGANYKTIFNGKESKAENKEVNKINSDKKENIKVNTDALQKEDKKDYTITNQEGEEVKINANKTVTATGFAGASNHVFYLDGSDLYYMDLSQNSKELIATGATDLYLNGEDVTCKLGSDGKVIKENNYITYDK